MEGEQKNNQMKILFLDVDGVLNNVRTRTRTEDGFYFVEECKIALVKELVGRQEQNLFYLVHGVLDGRR